MKKLRAFLVILLAVLVFAGCQTASDDNEFFDSSLGENDNATDFNGMVFKFCADMKSSSATFLSYYKDTSFGDLSMARFDAVEKAHNCTIEYATDISSVESIFTYVAAGNYACDVFIEHIFYGGNEFKETGVLLPLSAVSDIIDYTDAEKWGSPNLLEEFVYEDDIYGVVPISWPENCFMSLDFFLVFNSDITARLGLPDPRSYRENGEWDTSKYEEVIKEYTFTNDRGEHVYGTATDARHVVDMAFKAFNVPIAMKNENGEWTSGYFTAEGHDALAWVEKLYSKEYEDYISAKTGVGTQVTEWVAGRLSIALLCSNYAFSTSSSGDSSCEVSYSGIPFALLPFPSKDGNTLIGQYERSINGILFPVWVSDPEATATVVNDIFEPLEGFETLDKLIDYYSSNLFFDRRDSELVFSMQKVCRYLFHDEGVNTLDRNLATYILNHSAAETLDKFENEILTVVTEEIAPVKEGMKTLFGYED